MHTEPRMTVRRALLMVFVLVGWLHSGAARADSGTDRKPFEAVIVELKAVDDEKVAAWKKEGFRAIVVVVDDRHEAAVLKKAAKAVAAGSLDLYYWIEIGRNPAMAKEHPQWMASFGGHHDDWRKRFPELRKLQEGEVAKVWPWVPIGYREAFDAHLAKVSLLLERIPAGYRGLLLNDLQGGPSSCGCGNLQCRWAVDYGGTSTATKLGGADTAAKFVAAVRKLAKDKEVIPVWTTECEHEDLSPERQRPKGGWSTGYCDSVNCFDTCAKKFTEQWTALLEGQRGPVGVLALHKEFQRDRKEYGDSAGWISHVMDYLDKVKPVVGRQRTWLVVQGYDVSAEEEAAARRAAGKTGAGAVLVARARLDQSYEPRIVKEMDEFELFPADKIK